MDTGVLRSCGMFMDAKLGVPLLSAGDRKQLCCR